MSMQRLTFIPIVMMMVVSLMTMTVVPWGWFHFFASLVSPPPLEQKINQENKRQPTAELSQGQELRLQGHSLTSDGIFVQVFSSCFFLGFPDKY